jgi:hypothetical protein
LILRPQSRPVRPEELHQLLLARLAEGEAIGSERLATPLPLDLVAEPASVVGLTAPMLLGGCMLAAVLPPVVAWSTRRRSEADLERLAELSRCATSSMSLQRAISYDMAAGFTGGLNVTTLAKHGLTRRPYVRLVTGCFPVPIPHPACLDRAHTG